MVLAKWLDKAKEKERRKVLTGSRDAWCEELFLCQTSQISPKGSLTFLGWETRGFLWLLRKKIRRYWAQLALLHWMRWTSEGLIPMWWERGTCRVAELWGSPHTETYISRGRNQKDWSSQWKSTWDVWLVQQGSRPSGQSLLIQTSGKLWEHSVSSLSAKPIKSGSLG